LTATLYDIYNNEEWLCQHAEVEDHIFTPAIKRLERLTRQDDVSKNISAMVFKGGQDNGDTLSDREKDVIIGVVQGLQNKEIADRLCNHLPEVDQDKLYADYCKYCTTPGRSIMLPDGRCGTAVSVASDFSLIFSVEGKRPEFTNTTAGLIIL
jgi:hypothetical protein